MVSPEFGEYFSNIDPETITKVTADWFQLPVYTQIPIVARERLNVLTKLQGDVKGFIEQGSLQAKGLVNEGRHSEALLFMDHRLELVGSTFTGDEAITARIYTLRRRAYVKEHLATSGEFSKLPSGTPGRTLCFASAAQDYMQADLELGSVSDFALRISECFGGAGLHTTQMSAIQKVLGDNVTVIRRGSPGEVVVKDLERRATEIIDLSDKGPVKSFKIVSGTLPDPKSN